jgi:hypothetical protein
LLLVCLRYGKQSQNEDLLPAFKIQLVQALVDCLPQLLACSSAGSMRWFFTLLNRVKVMDPSLVAHAATDMLSAVSQQYRRNMSPEHALLKTRCD